MDIHHLESDELAVEFSARNMDQLAQFALENLSMAITEERSGTREKPNLPHPLKTSSEMSLCKRKLIQMEQERLKFEGTGDIRALEVLRSRAVHLVERLERLRLYATENIGVPLILDEARKMLERIVPARFENVGGNDSVEEDLEGFDQQGAAVTRATNLNQVSPRSDPGAYVGTATDASKGKSPRTGQLPTWDIDPSIIVAGRASVPPMNRVNAESVFQSFVRSTATNGSRGQAANATSNSHGVNHSQRNPLPVARQNYALDPPLSFLAAEDPAQRGVPQGRQRPGLTHTLSKWTVRFGGSAKDLAVDEFFFRVENLAAADNVHAESLILGLHCLLTGFASDFYWVQRRKHPNHTWAALKRSMIAHFAKQETDLEIRKLIMERRQNNHEGFGEFSLAVECLAARLNRQMDDEELMEILRQNMSSKLQTCLLMFPTYNVEALKGACLKYERLWASQNESLKNHNVNRRMAELGFAEVSPQVEEVRGSVLGRPNAGVHEVVEGNNFEIAAMAPAKTGNRTEYSICWNCDDIGHTFADCSSQDRKIFCYGCGTKNIYKPTCPRCNPGNPKTGGILQGRSRSTPNPFVLNRTNTGQPPQ